MSYDSIITVGCSFTYNSEMTWVSQLLQRVDIPVFNGATCASSNQNIVRTAMYHIEKYKNPLLIVQLSGIHRKSYYIEQDNFISGLLRDEISGKVLETVHRDIFYINNYLYHNDKENLPNDNLVTRKLPYWLHSGGNSFDYSNAPKIIKDKVVDVYKFLYSEQQQYIETLESIIMLQNYCKLNNIDSLYFWWKPELPLYKHLTDYDYLKNMINWDIVLPEKQSVLKWLVDTSSSGKPIKYSDFSNGEHPSKVMYDLWCSSVLLPELNKRFDIDITYTKTNSTYDKTIYNK